jgi:hypothetical protein
MGGDAENAKDIGSVDETTDEITNV